MANLIDNDAKVIIPGNYGYGHPTVVSFDDGTLFAGHINDLGDLEIHKSEDDGSSWVINQTIVPSSGIVYFNLCYRHTASVDELFVLYSDGVTTYKVRKRDDEGSWSLVYTLSPVRSNTKVLLRFDRTNDYLQIVYRLDTNNMKSKYSTDGGSSWNSGLTFGLAGILHDFDLYANGDILFSFEYATVVRFSKTGVYVSATAGLGTGYKWKNLLVNSSNNWLEVGYNSGSTQIEMAGLLTDTWVVGINNLKVGIDGDDNIYIFYTKTSDEKVYYRKYDGSWGSETLLVNIANNKFNCEKRSVPSINMLHYIYYTA